MLRQVFANRRHSIQASLSSNISNPLNRDYSLLLNSHFLAAASPEFPNNDIQVRWKRRDGNKKFLEQRKPTRKQKKLYRRRERELFNEKVGKHSPPGSKAGPSRQFDEETRQQYLNWDKIAAEAEEEAEYDINDAILDDMVGNTAELTASPTPEPMYYGHKHKSYYNRVATQMALYKQLLQQEEGDNESRGLVDYSQLPTDQDISLVVRSFRDRHGTRRKPVGVVKALEHLLKDLEVPIALFSEKTFTSLLTCCSTPTEARRIFRLMQEYQHPISEYSWSILVDIHAKLGDFEGCDQVMREMVTEGVHPTLPAYTSLLAACYKGINSGHSSRKTRIKAGELGWAKWKEMRIVGVEADAMAYGAILRICAARGQAERAKNLLEEMYTFEVKPTTLCFTSALRAVARSHQIAIRFENGASKKFRRRQMVASYHGRLAREVVILAETTEVKYDDGFISALILCAGTAGDSATAKAILLASEIRKLDHLRTIGSDKHLARLRGGDNSDDETLGLGTGTLSQRFLSGDEDAANTIMNQSSDVLSMSNKKSSSAKYSIPSFEKREYGKDCRVLSTLLQACSKAVDSNGIGEMWEGRDNKGYLCENSLRTLEVKPEPKYHDNSIPGISTDEMNMANLKWDKEEPEHLSKRLRRKKFEGIEFDDTGTNLDDLDPALYKYYEADDPALKRRNPDAVEEALPEDDPAWDIKGLVAHDPKVQSESVEMKSNEEWVFDVKDRKWKSHTSLKSEDESRYSNIIDDADQGDYSAEKSINGLEEKDDECYYDKNETSSLEQQNDGGLITFGKKGGNGSDAHDTKPPWEMDVPPPSFDEFFDQLKQEIDEDGTKIEFSEEEARELYDMMNSDEINMNIDEEMTNIQKEIEELEKLEEFGGKEPEYIDAKKHNSLMEIAESAGFETSLETDGIEDLEEQDELALTLEQQNDENAITAIEPYDRDVTSIEDDTDYMLEELKIFLPGMPEERLRKVKKAFASNLDYPSIITLTTILRENMPERVTPAWLKRKNTQNAYFVVEKAKEDGLMNDHLLNGVLQVETSTGSIDRALACHEYRFQEYNLTPSEYSDRLVLEMLIKNHRLPRALQFKEKVEENGRNLDLISFGLLIGHYAKHRKIGSALMLLKECISIHDAAPNERSLNELRRLCRHQHLTEEVGLEDLVGPDPLAWLRHGQASLKREYSKAGRRQVLLPKHRAVDI
mmetsp:Transcript_25618/g.38685  ORF Transcript_25618/g.38685 Transcript_25618/m.38685 type:complete len:1202 (+) Transcript_25618:171-3776(+)